MHRLQRIVGIWYDNEGMIVCLGCAKERETAGAHSEIDAFDAFENVGRTCGRCKHDLLTPEEIAQAALVDVSIPECRNCGAPCIGTYCSTGCAAADQD